MFQSILQVLAELCRAVVDQGVGELGCKRIAGMVGADQPLAHGQGFYARGGHHITRAGIHKHLQPQEFVGLSVPIRLILQPVRGDPALMQSVVGRKCAEPRQTAK